MDPWLIKKVRHATGLYLNPQEDAMVTRVDEKKQIHALDPVDLTTLGSRNGCFAIGPCEITISG